jgi:hypothetical protein
MTPSNSRPVLSLEHVNEGEDSVPTAIFYPYTVSGCEHERLNVRSIRAVSLAMQHGQATGGSKALSEVAIRGLLTYR